MLNVHLFTAQHHVLKNSSDDLENLIRRFPSWSVFESVLISDLELFFLIADHK